MKFLPWLMIFVIGTWNAQALDLRLESSNKLKIYDSKGEEAGEFELGTVAQLVDVDDQKFVLSFGQDTSGYLMAILSPAPESPKKIALRIASEKPVTIAAVESGLIGKMTVNGNSLPTGMRWTPDHRSHGPFKVTADESSALTVYWRGVPSSQLAPITPIASESGMKPVDPTQTDLFETNVFQESSSLEDIEVPANQPEAGQ